MPTLVPYPFEIPDTRRTRKVRGYVCIAFAYRIARRRALAELKAFLGDTCVHCTDGMTYRDGIHPLADGSGGFICTDFRLRDRIAAIEAEES